MALDAHLIDVDEVAMQSSNADDLLQSSASWMVAFDRSSATVHVVLGTGLDEECKLDMSVADVSAAARAFSMITSPSEALNRHNRAGRRSWSLSASGDTVRFAIAAPQRPSREADKAADRVGLQSAQIELTRAEAGAFCSALIDAARMVVHKGHCPRDASANAFARVLRNISSISPHTLSRRLGIRRGEAEESVMSTPDAIAVSGSGAFGVTYGASAGQRLSISGSLDDEPGTFSDAKLGSSATNLATWSGLAWVSLSRDAELRKALAATNALPITLTLTKTDVEDARAELSRVTPSHGWRPGMMSMVAVLANAASGLSLPEYRKTLLGHKQTGRVFTGKAALDQLSSTFGNGRYRTIALDVRKALDEIDGPSLKRFATVLEMAVSVSETRTGLAKGPPPRLPRPALHRTGIGR